LHSLYIAYGGGGGGGGVVAYEATTVNYDDSMTINVAGGAGGEGDYRGTTCCDERGQLIYNYRVGLVGSDGKVFMNRVEV